MSAPPVYQGYTAAELQAQYSARAAVPEHGQIFDRWRADSAAFRQHEAVAARLDLAYGSRPRQRIDLFHPDGVTPSPLHVFFHGGYWQAMSRQDFSFVARGLNARGIAVAVAGYSLCPEASLAQLIDETRDAVAWLHDQRDRLGIDRRPMQLSGHSAGGQIVAMLAATATERLGGAGIDWVAPVSGLFDLEPLVYTAMNEALGLDVAGARALSPLDLAPRAPVTVDAWVGGDESAEFHRQSRQFTQQWQAHGACALHTLPDCNHFTVIDTLFAAEGPLVRRAGERLARG